MFCPKCGTSIEDTSSNFCHNCGMKMSQIHMQPNQNQSYYTSNTYEHPMKWYKFLIYFSLFASALANFVIGISTLMGTQYGESAKYVYSYYNGLRGLDIIIGFATIILAFFCLVVRSRLAGFYENGPKMLLFLYAGSAILNLIYIVGIVSILGEVADALIPNVIISLISTFIIIFINKSYFDKRKELFIY